MIHDLNEVRLVPSNVLTDSMLSPTARVTYAIICVAAGEHVAFTAPADILANNIGVPLDVFGAAIRELVHAGILMFWNVWSDDQGRVVFERPADCRDQSTVWVPLADCSPQERVRCVAAALIDPLAILAPAKGVQ